MIEAGGGEAVVLELASGGGVRVAAPYYRTVARAVRESRLPLVTLVVRGDGGTRSTVRDMIAAGTYVLSSEVSELIVRGSRDGAIDVARVANLVINRVPSGRTLAVLAPVELVETVATQVAMQLAGRLQRNLVVVPASPTGFAPVPSP